MPIDWTAQLVDQLEFYWARLRPRLDGLGDDEYRWEPVAGMASLRRRDEVRPGFTAAGAGEWVVEHPDPHDELPAMTTIAWRLAHIAVDIFGRRASSHFGDGSFGRDAVEWRPAAAFGLALLDEQHDLWVDGVRKLAPDDLGRPVGPAEGPFAEHPFAALVLHITREAVHHGAETLVLRDLYRNRATPEVTR